MASCSLHCSIIMDGAADTTESTFYSLLPSSHHMLRLVTAGRDYKIMLVHWWSVYNEILVLPLGLTSGSSVNKYTIPENPGTLLPWAC